METSLSIRPISSGMSLDRVKTDERGATSFESVKNLVKLSVISSDDLGAARDITPLHCTVHHPLVFRPHRGLCAVFAHTTYRTLPQAAALSTAKPLAHPREIITRVLALLERCG